MTKQCEDCIIELVCPDCNSKSFNVAWVEDVLYIKCSECGTGQELVELFKSKPCEDCENRGA